MKLTRFIELEKAIRLFGANKSVQQLAKELETGKIDADFSNLICGETGIYLIREDGLLTRVIVHIVDINIKGGYFGKDARRLVKSKMYDDSRLLKKIHKYHLVNCSTLQTAKDKGWSEKFKMSQRQDGKFFYRFIQDDHIHTTNDSQKLVVCGNCLKEINLLNESKETYEKTQFSPSIFFSEEFQNNWLPSSSNNHYARDSVPNMYSKDWDKISLGYKERMGFICEGENCSYRNLNTPELKKYLNCHHVNMDKANSKYSNLKALCILCHANQPNHGHLKSSNEYKKYKKIINV